MLHMAAALIGCGFCKAVACSCCTAFRNSHSTNYQVGKYQQGEKLNLQQQPKQLQPSVGFPRSESNENEAAATAELPTVLLVCRYILLQNVMLHRTHLSRTAKLGHLISTCPALPRYFDYCLIKSTRAILVSRTPR
jgi:hypothetical protein